MKNPLTPAGIEPATYRYVAEHLKHCATAVPTLYNEQFRKLYCNLNWGLETKKTSLCGELERIEELRCVMQNFTVRNREKSHLEDLRICVTEVWDERVASVRQGSET